jgi:hypothetical protein
VQRPIADCQRREARSTTRRFALLLAGWLATLAVPAPADAGEPLATDDASILERGVCQFEAWHRWSPNGGHEGWGVPACSVTDWLELGAGFARSRERDAGSHTLVLLQAKSVFAGDADGRWAAGAVVSGLRDGAREGGQAAFHQSSALGLVSFALPEQRLRVHANAGIVHDRDDGTTGAWGTALEYDFFHAWTALAEVFRDGPGRASYQLGVRYTLVTDRVELFASGGERFGGGSDWFAKFGVRFQSWPLF